MLTGVVFVSVIFVVIFDVVIIGVNVVSGDFVVLQLFANSQVNSLEHSQVWVQFVTVNPLGTLKTIIVAFL